MVRPLAENIDLQPLLSRVLHPCLPGTLNLSLEICMRKEVEVEVEVVGNLVARGESGRLGVHCTVLPTIWSEQWQG